MLDIKQHTVNTVEEFTSLISKKLNYDSNPVFRGHGKLSDKLVPVLFRYSAIPGECTNWDQFEQSLITRFQKQAFGLLDRRPENLVDWICLARHHGLPTRLLDWTDDPLTSLWFSVQNQNDHNVDGCVWQMASSSMLITAANDFSGLKRSFESHPMSVFRYHPKYISPRISAQRGLFSIQKTPNNIESFIPLEDRYRNGFTGIRLIQYKVPAVAKLEILHKLDRLGIDAFRAFPDLDGLCNKLKWEIDRDVATGCNKVHPVI